MEESLVSIGVLSYKNTQYLYECLNSIFAQIYGNIELIISNDGSDCFDAEAVLRYVNENVKSNIKKVIINKNERNLGTVRHCNVVLEMCQGDYIMFIACDDVYSNENVIKNMVNGFSLAPPDVELIVNRFELRSENLCDFLGYFPSKNTAELINELSPAELYRKHLAVKNLFVGGMYKKEAFEKYGRYNEKFFIIEDWSSAISFTRQGMKSYCLDFVTIIHRDGGVSFSRFNRESFAQEMFVLDCIKIRETIISEGANELDDEVLETVCITCDDFKQLYQEIWGKVRGYSAKEGVNIPDTIVFGVGRLLKNYSFAFDKSFIKYYVDNDSSKWGSVFNGKPVVSPQKLNEEKKGEFVVLIAVESFLEVKEQLLQMNLIDENNIYSYAQYCRGFYVPQLSEVF